jgi:hypothetical protein
MLMRTLFLSLAVLLAVAAQQVVAWNAASGQEDAAEFHEVPVVIRTAAGELVTGYMEKPCWLSLRDSRGRTVWEKAFPHREGGRLTRAIAVGAGGFLAGGSVNAQMGPAWIVRLGPDGATRWEQTFAEDDSYSVSAMAPGRNGGFFVAGGASSGAPSARWAARLDDQGKILWGRRFDSPESGGVAEQIEAVSDGGVIVAGQHWTGCMCEGYHKGEPWAARLNGKGETVWEKSFEAVLASDER